MLTNSFLISSKHFFENSAKAIPPSAALPNGKLVVSTGSPFSILHRPIYDSDGNFDTTSETEQPTLPVTPTQSIGTDNQMVRLKDGSLLTLRAGCTWSDISPTPAWFNETVTGSRDRKKQRGCEFIFRSIDSGESWQLHSTIDWAAVLNGKYGYPRPMSNTGATDVLVEQQGKYPDGSLKWWIAGGDRQELYACPFTGLVYVTTRVVSGSYKNIAPHYDAYILLYSKDSGKTWEVIKDDFPGWEPLVITSTPNGRLFLFQCVGSQPTVYFSKNLANTTTKPEISPGYATYYVENGANIPCAGDNSNLITFGVATPAISRISVSTTSSKIRAAYQAVNPDGRQEARVIRIELQNVNQAPTITPVKVIRADNSKDYSVMHFSFIDPDYVDIPAEIKSNASMLYWIESPKQGLNNPKFAARYVMFEGNYNTSCPGFLSVKDGVPSTWASSEHPGDYLAGGFFWKNNTLNYFAHWTETDGLRANIVSIPYQLPSGNPSFTCTAAWQRSSEEEIQVYDWQYADYRKKYDDLWSQGWRLHLLKNRVFNNQVLYTAVWRKGTFGEIQVYDYRYEDYRKTYDEFWNQGWRLHILNNYVVNGKVLYTAVWREGTVGEIQVYGWAYEDYRKKYDELWNQGWRLKILNNYVVNGQVSYTAVWQPSTVGEIQVYGWAYEDYRKKYDELWNQGWRLKILNNYVVNGQVSYTAVWQRPAPLDEIQVYEWSYEDFKKKYDELWCNGWRLKILDVF